MISTRDLSGLPDVDGLRRLLQSLAVLDAILSPEWEYRHYSFNSKWARGKQMGSMRNGSGDDFFALFNRHGCFLKGFAHEYPMSPYRDDGSKWPWPGVLDAVPAEFADGLGEPAFSTGDTTFCVWRRHTDPGWRRGDIAFPPDHPDPDGSGFLLALLDGRPETYADFAADYFGRAGANRERVLDVARHVYAHRPLDADMVESINPDLTLKDLAADLAEIGYPARRGKK